MLNATPETPVTNPLDALLAADGAGVLAIVVDVLGPSYRPVGAFMAILEDGSRVGSLSSGCIEADLAIHAQKALTDGEPTSVRYGAGSPFVDIALPCGGGLEILLVPRPDKAVLQQVVERRDARIPCTLTIDTESGTLCVADDGQTGADGVLFHVRLLPPVRFFVFGKGPEASTFAALVQSAGYPNLLASPDVETLEAAERAGCETRHLIKPDYPTAMIPDPRTAIVLFFHDHEWEPPILHAALKTDAFYIGAQGSQRARDARHAALHEMGVDDAGLERLHGPIGLIPSARDPKTLAISVLAEVVAKAMVAGE